MLSFSCEKENKVLPYEGYVSTEDPRCLVGWRGFSNFIQFFPKSVIGRLFYFLIILILILVRVLKH